VTVLEGARGGLNLALAPIFVLSPLVMVALCNRADHNIFMLFLMATLCNRGAIIFLPCDFYLLSIFFFSRLISAATDWMSTILWHMVWP